MKKVDTRFIYWGLFLLYIVLVFIVGIHHEQWADEAQSWLISRDISYFNIFFTETKYEGHPFVWFFIEKTFINIFSSFTDSSNLYNWVFLLPLFFSSVGVYLFLFKSKFPLCLKILVPFTFYIFYQYGVIARNHCLCFPMLAIIAAFYSKKFEHPFIYILLLIINANISAYLYPISLVLIIFFIYESFQYEDKREKMKYLYFNIMGLFCLLLLAFQMYNPTDCYFWRGIDYSPEHLYEELKGISNIYFPQNDIDIEDGISFFFTLIFYFVLTISLYFCTMKVYCKNIKQIIFFLSLNIPFFIICTYLYSSSWHYGYALVILIFTCWILTDKNHIYDIPIKGNAFFYVFILCVLGYYIVGNIQICLYDINNNYSGSKDVANFLKSHSLQSYKINGIGFKTVAIQPYFKRNLYENYINATHFSWRQNFYDNYAKKSKRLTPIIIVSNFDLYRDNKILKKIEKTYYKCYEVPGKLQNLNLKKGKYEDEAFYVYINKELQNEIDICRL
ncbi:hypothetical protein IJ182_08500 [bacterium]|nr:hypothetical protein [bacterium]